LGRGKLVGETRSPLEEVCLFRSATGEASRKLGIPSKLSS